MSVVRDSLPLVSRPSRARRRRRNARGVARLLTAVAVALGVVLLTATSLGQQLGLPDVLGARPAPFVIPIDPARHAAAEAALATLPVKGRAPRTGYSREEFGPAWADVDRNGCDTRNDVIARDLTGITVEPDTRGCVVLTGTLVDPYGGASIDFERGERSAEVQIDHVVALADAWQKGAQALTPERRREFANDPGNLLAVDGPLNEAKGASDAATWLPPNRGVRCAYATLQVEVKAEYGLWVTAAERDALARELDRCVLTG